MIGQASGSPVTGRSLSEAGFLGGWGRRRAVQRKKLRFRLGYGRIRGWAWAGVYVVAVARRSERRLRRSLEQTVRALRAQEAIGPEHALLVGLMRHAAELAEGPEGEGLSDSERRQWCRLLALLEARARQGLIQADDEFSRLLSAASDSAAVDWVVRRSNDMGG